MRAVLLSLALLFALPAFGQDDVDPLSLAARLIADNNWERAALVLEETTEDEVADTTRLHTLRGLVALHQGDFAAAEKSLLVAAEAEEADPLLFVQIAQARLGLDNPEGALEALDQGGAALDSQAAAYLLRARAQQTLGDFEAAWTALDAGLARFPEHAELNRQQLFLLVDLGLYRQAVDQGRVVFDQADAETWTAFGDALNDAGATDAAIEWLEEGRLRDASHSDGMVLLAKIYLDAGQATAAGQVLQAAAELDGAFYMEAAECFRQAKAFDRALYLNSMVPDAKDKARQRLGLLLQLERYTETAGMEPRLRRLDLLEDQQLLYALAFAWFRIGRFEQAERLLGELSDPNLFAQATSLRETMETCRTTPAACP